MADTATATKTSSKGKLSELAPVTEDAPDLFDFSSGFETLEAVPEVKAEPVSRANELPFRRILYPAMAAKVVEAGKPVHRFVPLAFFTQRGAQINEKVGPNAYMKDKLRAAFKKFQEDHAGKPEADLKLLMIWRDGTAEDFKQEGLSVYLQK